MHLEKYLLHDVFCRSVIADEAIGHAVNALEVAVEEGRESDGIARSDTLQDGSGNLGNASSAPFGVRGCAPWWLRSGRARGLGSIYEAPALVCRVFFTISGHRIALLSVSAIRAIKFSGGELGGSPPWWRSQASTTRGAPRIRALNSPAVTGTGVAPDTDS
jgi:hypothetical protein